MFKNPLYKYGEQNAQVSAHLHYGKEIFDQMLENKHITALINAETNESMTYEELAQKSANIALSLIRMGVGKGDVIGVCSDLLSDVTPTLLGILFTGATFTPIHEVYGTFPMIHILRITKPKLIFSSVAYYEEFKSTFEAAGITERMILFGERQDNTSSFEEFLTETAVDLKEFQPIPVDGCVDKCIILFTSGTTGLPKGIPHTHMSLLLNRRSIVPDCFRHSRILLTREWYSPYGLRYILAGLCVSSTFVYLVPQNEEDVLQAVQKHKTNLLQLVPLDITRFNKSTTLENYDVSSVEWVILGNASISGEVTDAVKTRFPNLKCFYQIYGVTEAGSICNDFYAPLGPRPGSCGVPSLDYIIKVVDFDTRQPLGPNQRGEICYKGPCLMKAYMNNVSPDCKDSEGFFKSGDVGYYDEDGYFYVVNRIKDLIKFCGLSIAPGDFETLLEKHPAVYEAGVIGLPHEEYGEAPVAFVVLQPGKTATEQELVEYLNDKVPVGMKLAGGVRFIDQLPRGIGAKMDRKEMKRLLGIKP